MSSSSTVRIIPIDPFKPDPFRVQEVCGVLEEGGVVVFPTETLYGIGADPDHDGALQRVFSIKERERDKPVLLLVGEASWVERLAAEIPPEAQSLMERFWPGGLTLLLQARHGLPLLLTGREGRIGLRCSSHPVAQAIVRVFGRPVTATSANLSGEKGPSSLSEISPRLIERVDLIVDSGTTPEGRPSTVVDVTSSIPSIVREGAIPRAEIEAHIRRIKAGAKGKGLGSNGRGAGGEA